MGVLVSPVGEVAAEIREVAAHLVESLLGFPVSKVHVGDRGQVEVGALELAHGRTQDLAPLVGGPRLRKLEDGVAHLFKLEAGTLGPRLAQAKIPMDPVWRSLRSFNLA